MQSHTTTEPVFSPEHNNLMVPRAASQMDNRISTSSLIDLDESVAEPVSRSFIRRPSAANSDLNSEVGGAFDLEQDTSSSMPQQSFSTREPSIYVSSNNREPSLYVPSDADFPPPSNREPSLYVADGSDFAASVQATQQRPLSKDGGQADDSSSSRPTSAYSSHGRNGSASSGLTVSPEYVGGSGGRRRRRASSSLGYAGGGGMDGRPLPLLPGPPSERVMMGEGGAVMREEFLRLLGGMTSHLKFAGEYVAELPVKTSRRSSAANVLNGQGQGLG